MTKLKNYLAVIGASLATLIPQAALAQTYDYDYSSDVTSDAAAAGVGIFLLVVFGVIAIVGVVSLIFWIMMLVHASSHDIPDKNMWIILLLVSLVIGAGLIGALVYYFVVKRKFDAGQTTPAQPAAAGPSDPAKGPHKK